MYVGIDVWMYLVLVDKTHMFCFYLGPAFPVPVPLAVLGEFCCSWGHLTFMNKTMDANTISIHRFGDQPYCYPATMAPAATDSKLRRQLQRPRPVEHRLGLRAFTAACAGAAESFGSDPAAAGTRYL